MKHLRIEAVLGERMPAWTLRSVELLEASGACALTRVGSPRRPDQGGLALRCFRELDRKFFFPRPHALDQQPAAGKPAAEAGREHSAAADVVFDPANLLGADSAGLAGKRLWQYQGCGPGLGLREVAVLAPYVRIALVERAPGEEITLAESTGERDTRSMARTQDALLWRAAELPLRVVRRLAAGAAPPGPIGARDFGISDPGLLDVARAGLRVASRVITDRARDRLRPAKWCIGWQPKSAKADVTTMKWLVAPPGRCWADPFPHEHGQHRGIFLEESPVPIGRGSISYLPWNFERQDWDAALSVLREPFHLSYPFVFEHEGRVYMVPETAEAGQVRLYRCDCYPGEWKLERVLLDGIIAVDSTLLQHQGRWWLFAAVAVPRSRPDELCLFHAASPLGPFEPHPLNPVLSDLRAARPAGRIFVENGVLLRPSQDCAGGYGRALVFNRIVELTPDRYREEIIRRIDPGWQPEVRTIHTWNESANLTCIDSIRSVKQSRF